MQGLLVYSRIILLSSKLNLIATSLSDKLLEAYAIFSKLGPHALEVLCSWNLKLLKNRQPAVHTWKEKNIQFPNLCCWIFEGQVYRNSFLLGDNNLEAEQNISRAPDSATHAVPPCYCCIWYSIYYPHWEHSRSSVCKLLGEECC